MWWKFHIFLVIVDVTVSVDVSVAIAVAVSVAVSVSVSVAISFDVDADVGVDFDVDVDVAVAVSVEAEVEVEVEVPGFVSSTSATAGSSVGYPASSRTSATLQNPQYGLLHIILVHFAGRLIRTSLIPSDDSQNSCAILSDPLSSRAIFQEIFK